MKRVLGIAILWIFALLTQAQTYRRENSSEVYDNPVGLKSNLLYDVALVPNVGIEITLPNWWSVGGNWMAAWWNNDRTHYYWRIYGGELYARRYFGAKAKERVLSGHHAELYGQLFTYDFELGEKGYISHFSYGMGVAYGYSIYLNRALNLDLNIGVGYLGGGYEKYNAGEHCYPWESTHRRHWFGLSKAEITLVWIVNWGGDDE